MKLLNAVTSHMSWTHFFDRNLPLYSVRATCAKLMYSGSIRASGQRPALLPKVQCQANTKLGKYYRLCSLCCSGRGSTFRQRAAWKVPSCVQDLNFKFCLTNWNHRNNSVNKTEPSPKFTFIWSIICPPSIRDEGNRQLLPSFRKKKQWLFTVRDSMLVSLVSEVYQTDLSFETHWNKV